MSTTQLRGKTYELATMRILEREGFTVRHLAADKFHGSDLEIGGGVLVECKGSVPHKINQWRNGYSFVIHRFGKSAALEEHAVILLCVTPTGEECFVIPADLVDTNYISISATDLNKYTGRWAIYRNAFSLLDELGAKRKRPN